MFNNLPSELLGFMIGSVAGLARYLSLVLQEVHVFHVGKLFMRVIIAGIVGILSIYVAPLITDNPDLQRAVAFLGGIAAQPIMNIIEQKLPSLISKKIDEL